MGALPLTINSLCKAEMEYHSKFVHTIGRIYHIAIMRTIHICYTDFRLGTQTVAPNFPGVQDLKRYIQ